MLFKKYILNYSRNYYWGLILLAISLPFSKFLLSVSLIFLCINWILEGDFKRKFDIILQKKSLLVIYSVYLLHVIGFFYSEDIVFALHDLRIKSPLLVLPLIVGTTVPLQSKQFKLLLVFFISSVFLASLVSSSIWAGIINNNIYDTRDISIFISHIRFSLLVNVAIFSIAYFIFSVKYSISIKEKMGYMFLILWFILFLFILQSFTGIVIFFVTTFLCVILYIRKIRNLFLRLITIVLSVTSILVIASFITKSIGEFYFIEDIDKKTIDKYTSKGNLYTHDFTNKQIENNNYIWLYICEKELREEWNKISNYSYDGKDERDQELKHTLIRYLTSKGYKKDADGISKLNKEDIRFIEKGSANYIYNTPFSFRSKIYQKIWEIDVYRKGGNSSGHSVTQRLIYLKTAFNIIKDNFWFGVGTGDIKTAYENQYRINNTPLSKKWQLRTHNQFITFFVTFGIIGFLWILFAFLYPVFYEEKLNFYFLVIFLIISFLSMLNEDTLETHVGICFFSFFYSIFLFGVNKSLK